MNTLTIWGKKETLIKVPATQPVVISKAWLSAITIVEGLTKLIQSIVAKMVAIIIIGHVDTSLNFNECLFRDVQYKIIPEEKVMIAFSKPPWNAFAKIECTDHIIEPAEAIENEYIDIDWTFFLKIILCTCILNPIKQNAIDSHPNTCSFIIKF